MNDTHNAQLNDLFTKFEKARNFADHLNQQSLYSNNPEVSREVYGQVFEEVLEELAIIQKRIVRVFFKSGDLGELFGHIDCGTFPPKAIQAAMNRQ